MLCCVNLGLSFTLSYDISMSNVFRLLVLRESRDKADAMQSSEAMKPHPNHTQMLIGYLYSQEDLVGNSNSVDFLKSTKKFKNLDKSSIILITLAI